MDSRARLNDSLLGLLISGALVAVACGVFAVVDVHREEHGHNVPKSRVGMEGSHRPEDRAGGEGQQVGGWHAPFFASAGTVNASQFS